jgi:hypothetical protein
MSAHDVSSCLSSCIGKSIFPFHNHLCIGLNRDNLPSLDVNNDALINHSCIEYSLMITFKCVEEKTVDGLIILCEAQRFDRQVKVS